MPLNAAQRRTINWAALAAAAVAFVWLLGPVLTPFMIGAVLAYALHPLVEQLAARRVPRVLAVVLVEIGAIAALAALMLLIVPILSKELPLLNDQLPVLVERANQSVTPWLKQMGVDVTLDGSNLRAILIKYLDANWSNGLAAALASARIGGSIVATVVGYLILIPVVLFFLLIDWPFYVLRVIALVPPRLRDRVASFTSDCDTVLGQYLRGQLLVMLMMAAFYSVG
ncbi:MAG TPA: AI-2E family transporter, partial [Caldimonas sp.]